MDGKRFMKKNLAVYGFSIILIILIFSGCQEQKTIETSYLEGIEFKSELVELIYSNITKSIDGEKVLNIDVKYLFKNVVGRDLNLKVFVEFYDKNDQLLYTGGPKYITLPNNWTEQGVSPANTISYSGKQANDVDHVTIIASE